jgi:hypothetical protein
MYVEFASAGALRRAVTMRRSHFPMRFDKSVLTLTSLARRITSTVDEASPIAFINNPLVEFDPKVKFPKVLTIQISQRVWNTNCYLGEVEKPTTQESKDKLKERHNG